MRVIAGSCRGKVLKSPTTDATRPTLDRVKEAIFSMIQEQIPEARVLDLFSGSGAMAIEALSRGASFALVNDHEKSAISTILFNLQLTNTQKYVTISVKEYLKCLKKIVEEELLFDVIFIDPPYASKYGLEALEYISSNPGKICAKDGLIVYETDKRFLSKEETTLENLECIKQKQYGRVVIKIYKWR